MDLTRVLRLATWVTLLLVLNTVLLLLLTRVPVGAIGPVTPACVSGDVNGDAVVDVADPVYLLNYLFGNGATPVACAQPRSPGPAFLHARSDMAPGVPSYSIFNQADSQYLPGLSAAAVSRAGVLKNLTITHGSTVPSYTGDFTVTLLVNGLATSLSASTLDSPSVNQVDTVSIAAGDVVTFRFDSLGAQATGYALCDFE